MSEPEQITDKKSISNEKQLEDITAILSLIVQQPCETEDQNLWTKTMSDTTTSSIPDFINENSGWYHNILCARVGITCK